MKIGSLCTGYGGLDMAVEAFFDAQMVWCAEIDKYASQLIATRFNKPNLGDIKQINWDTVEPIDILTAGYPCQPFSHAGQRKGLEDERHIWPYIIKAISTLRPRIVVLENVRGHLSLGFKEVLKDLAENGYDAKWQVVRASDVGAPHQRARLFIIAYPSGKSRSQTTTGFYSESQHNNRKQNSFTNTSSEGLQRAWYKTNDSTDGFVTNTDSDACEKSRRANREIPTKGAGLHRGQNIRQTWCQCGCSSEIDCNTNHKYQPHDRQMQELGGRFISRRKMHMQEVPNTLVDGKLNAKFVEYMMGLNPGWVTNLPFSRSQQLKMLGNGVVPQQAYYALELLCQ